MGSGPARRLAAKGDVRLVEKPLGKTLPNQESVLLEAAFDRGGAAVDGISPRGHSEGGRLWRR